MSAPPDELKTVPIHLFLAPHHDREDRDEALMQRMTASIQKEGFLQPIRCVPEAIDGKEWYRVVTGWTRILCGRRAGKMSAPAIIIRRPLTETDDLIQKLTENDLRGATSLKDRIRWYFKLLELNPAWSQAELAKAVHSAPAEVSKTLRISKDLLPELLDLVGEGDGKLPVTAAYAIARLKDPAMQKELSSLVLAGRLKRDSVEIEVTKRLGGKVKREKPLKIKDNGALAQLPGEWSWDQLQAWLGRLSEAARKGAKHNLPVSSLGSLLRA